MRTITLSDAAFAAIMQPIAREWSRLAVKCETGNMLGGPYSRRGIWTAQEIKAFQRKDNSKRVGLAGALHQCGIDVPKARPREEAY